MTFLAQVLKALTNQSGFLVLAVFDASPPKPDREIPEPGAKPRATDSLYHLVNRLQDHIMIIFWERS